MSPAKTSLWSVLGWAAYLACSWTWCIGMFLPVLLVRDYGIWGFVVFAVPNVIGAGAMGWVLRDGAAERIVQGHRVACVVFSIITMVFQAYFLFYIVDAAGDVAPLATSPSGSLLPWLAGAAAICAISLATLAGGSRVERWCAVVAWCVSAGIGLYLLSGHELAMPRVEPIDAMRDPWRLGLLAPVCVFGFALCPYLDLTFLKAAAVPSNSARRASFSLGFGVLFFAMILMTLGYSIAFVRVANGTSHWIDVPVVLIPVIAHMVLQIGFTIAVHGKEVSRTISRNRMMSALLVAGGAVLAGGMAWGIGERLSSGHVIMTSGEMIYRCFMSFYGLVFPAYVWLCMIPTRDGHSGASGERGRWKSMVLGGACALAAPCYWMGFIERVEWWLAPGLGVVLLARLLVRKSATISA